MSYIVRTLFVRALIFPAIFPNDFNFFSRIISIEESQLLTENYTWTDSHERFTSDAFSTCSIVSNEKHIAIECCMVNEQKAKKKKKHPRQTNNAIFQQYFIELYTCCMLHLLLRQFCFISWTRNTHPFLEEEHKSCQFLLYKLIVSFGETKIILIENFTGIRSHHV